MGVPVPEYDVAIVGAGIAGASAAYFLAPHAKVAVLERESQPGYHTTGRSAALFSETYGNAVVRALSRASRAFYESPPAGFAESPLLAPRGMLFFGRAEQRPQLEAHADELGAGGARIEWLDSAALRARVPVLRDDWSAVGLLEPEARDIDVHALLTGFLRGARARGARVLTDAEVLGVARAGGAWEIETRAGALRAGVLVDAAGAWADELATMAGPAPIGLSPLRRTAIVFECARFGGAARWPMAVDATEDLYFRPEAGRFLASPADETPSPPCDAQPEEFDVAVLLERLQAATAFEVTRITARWAGLRSFAPDRSLVAGFDPDCEGFYWLAGQGGYGIQTAPAMGMLAAAGVLGRALPGALADAGVEGAALSPARLRAAPG